jgi:RNA polymerase sigma-70 factor (ECF subfamily)
MNIVSDIKQGDLWVFEQVYNQYHQKLYFYLLNKTESAFYAEEITQISFIKLWQYREHLNENISIEMQIFRIAKTSFIDHLRKINTSEKKISMFKKSNKNFAMNGGLVNLETEELSKKLQALLSQMPPARREVFEMSRIQGLSHKEIAMRQSVSVKTVENHINHSLKQIRKVLQHYKSSQ